MRNVGAKKDPNGFHKDLLKGSGGSEGTFLRPE